MESRKILEELEYLERAAESIVFQWIPSHAGIDGNERADHLAKTATSLPHPQTTTTFSQQKSLIKTTMAAVWHIRHPDYNKTDPIHSLKRSSQVAIFRLRTGHNKLNHHMHTKLHIVDTPYCTCGPFVQDAEHILMHCNIYNSERTRFWPNPTPIKTKLYGGPADLQRTADFLAEIGVQP